MTSIKVCERQAAEQRRHQQNYSYCLAPPTGCTGTSTTIIKILSAQLAESALSFTHMPSLLSTHASTITHAGTKCLPQLQMRYEGAIGVGLPGLYENTSQHGEWVVKTLVRKILEAREAM